MDLSQVPRKPRRPAKSCLPCQKRKVGCDQADPCGPCVRARAPLICSYSSNTAKVSRSTSSKRGLPRSEDENRESSYVKRVRGASLVDPSISPFYEAGAGQQSELDHDASLLHDIQKRLEKVEERSARPERSTESSHRDFAESIQALRDQVRKLEAELQSTHEREVASKPTAALQTQPDIFIEPITPRLRITLDKTKLYGPSHWLHAAEKLPLVGRFDRREVELSLPAKHPVPKMKALRELRHSIKQQRSVTLQEPVPNICETLPDRETCDQLIRYYLKTFEPIYRILHVPSFWDMYEKFWSNQHFVPMSFHMKLVLVLAIGNIFWPDRTKQQKTFRQAQTWIYAAQWWLAGPTENTTYNLAGVQVACLLQLARRTALPRASTGLCAGTLMQMAMHTGLHRDPDRFPALTPYEAEMRRRLWASVVELTLLPSLDSPVSLSLSPEHYDTRAPANLNDHDLDPETGTVTASRAESEVTDTSLLRLLFQSIPLRLRITTIINSIHQEQSYCNTISLGREVRMACRRLAAFFHRAIELQPEMVVLTYSSFHRDFLDICLRRYCLSLHYPFMIRAREDARFYLARKFCLESAMVIGSYGNTPILPSEKQSDLSRLLLSVGGSIAGLFSLSIIIVLSLEIITQLEEAGVASSTSSDPLDKMARETRSRSIQILENIDQHLIHLISLGSPSLKRHGFLSVILGQVRALEHGESVDKAVCDALRDVLEESYTLLKASDALAPVDSFDTVTHPSTMHAEWDFGTDSNGLTEQGLPLDSPFHLYFLGMGNDARGEW